MLYNWTTYLNATINEAPKQNRLPKLKLEFVLSHLQMNIGTTHITIICKLLAYISLNSLYRRGIVRKFYNKNILFDDKKLYVATYAKYFNDKYEKKQDPKESMKTLEKIEEGLNYEQIELEKIEYY